MLEQLDLGQKVSKADYERRVPDLQNRLYDLEHALFRARLPVAVVFEGWAAGGKGTTIRTLTERLDPRGFQVAPILPPRTHETFYPWMWRFWLKVPARGQMVIFDTSWYRRVLIERVTRSVHKHEWQKAYQDIDEFEETLAADGTVIVKFWLHIGKKEQARRFKKVLKSKLTAWQVSPEDAAQHKHYKDYLDAVEEMLARTDTPFAPWTIVEATDRRYTRLKVFETLIAALQTHLPDAAPAPEAEAPAKPAARKKAGRAG
jgi:AMP-polyphosphate phosphotransferase